MTTIAVVGATGTVGEKFLEIAENNKPPFAFRLFASDKSTGRRVLLLGRNVTVENVERLDDFTPDYAVFLANEQIAERYVPSLCRRGCVCIDNSSAFRMSAAPLVVPCINGNLARGSMLVANPNCTTIQLAIAVNALRELNPTKITVATYQAASGAGREGIADLAERNGYGKLKCFRHPIYDNVIPAIGGFSDDGYTQEERKVMMETKKILNRPDLAVNCFAARVPVTVGHGVFANIRLEKPFTLQQVRRLLENERNVVLLDNPQNDVYPMPIAFRNTPLVGVGRITLDQTDNAVNCFIVADNLLRGAAYNAWEILKIITEKI